MPIKYKPADFRTIFNSCSIHSYPGASGFMRLLLSSAPAPLIKPKRGHRQGWEVALCHTPPLKQSIPYFISLNAAILFIQEIWISSAINSDLVFD